MDSETKLMDLIIHKLNALEESLVSLDKNLDSIDKTLIKQEASLEEHIKRTAILESKLEPVEAHVNKVNGAFVLLGVLSTILGILKLLNLI